MAKFKAIIIGGGPVGLVMAHALALADIDYTLYERRQSIVDREGAGIAVMPHVVRILHQLGVLEEACKIGEPMLGTAHVVGGNKGWRDNASEILSQKFGYNILLFERFRLMKLLLDSIPDREEHIRTGMTLKSIKEHDQGVSVAFEDGTVDEGSIVIGADGVHSTVRHLLSDMSAGEVEAMPFTTVIQGLYGHGPRIDGMRNGEVVENHHDGWAVQTLTGRDRTFYFIYAKLKQPTKDRRRFTTADTQEFMQLYSHEKVFGEVTFADLWERRDLGELRYLEQGVAKTWSRGRVVLVGDSVHKVTPNLGIGGNIGIESAASLANHLHALLKQESAPDSIALGEAFAAYRNQRFDVVESWYRRGYWHVKFLTFETKRHREMFEKQALKSGLDHISKFKFAKDYLDTVSQGIKLDYVPIESELSGTYPWATSTSVLESELHPKL
ncbi:hypothetical protein JX266_012630 [Neoarthrinium moseri]|nr:hypothetical protein JX266_012630 [Neoarthrinium moseri]